MIGGFFLFKAFVIILLMERKNKIIFLISIFLTLSFVWFDFYFIERNHQSFSGSLEDAFAENDVIIIFNSGGWGTVVFNEAEDFDPIIIETKKTVERLGYKTEVVTYKRTLDNFLAKIASTKEILCSFPNESERLALQIKRNLEQNPGKKVIIAGLSNGAVFVEETIEKLKDVDSVYGIELGTPFWTNSFKFENVLYLTNNGKDALATGNFKVLAQGIMAGFSNSDTDFAVSKEISHFYFWDEVRNEVENFVNLALTNP